jgi:RNA polymerase sigma-70 factor, ECF subfamily
MKPATSTFDLLERFRRGDSAAFSLLFEKYRRRLAVLIHYKISPEKRHLIDVDEVLQETFLAAFRQLDQFEYRAPGSLLSWLSRIADHVIVDHARFESRQKRHAAEMVRFRSESNPMGPEPADSRTPSRMLAEKEAVEALLARLNALPEDYRQVIVLAKVEGLSTQEIAERMDRSREAVSLLLHRAIQRFRRLQPGDDSQ